MACSPVQFLLDRARETARVERCGCEDCQEIMETTDVDDLILDRFIISELEARPAVFFRGMFEEWTIAQLCDQLSD
jgi:hypothetical protein